MKESLLKLVDFSVVKTEVKVNEKFNEKKQMALDASCVECKLHSTTGKYNKSTDAFFLFLEISIDAEKFSENNLPYQVHFEAAGAFSVDEKYDKDKEQFAVINGASLLYSSIREFLFFITGRYPFGPIQLPTVTFSHLSKQPRIQPAKPKKKPIKSK